MNAAANWLRAIDNGTEMARRILDADWSASALGDSETWPESLRSTLSICLSTRFPIAIYWGPELVLLYNDAWSPILGKKHPWALGRPAAEVWPEIWDTIGPLFDQVTATNDGVYLEDQLLLMHRHGYTEECYFNFTFSPVRDATGAMLGVFNAVIETTDRVIAQRRLRTSREVSGDPDAVEAALEITARALEANPADAPFAELFLLEDAEHAIRVGSVRCGAGAPANARVELSRAWFMPDGDIRSVSIAVVPVPDEVRSALELDPALVPKAAAFVPIRRAGEAIPTAILVLGTSARRAWDDTYEQFVTQIALQTARLLTSASALEQARERAEALAEVDRAKTAFFANVSHEFRTPLTLMLGSLDDVLGADDPLPEPAREQLAVVQQNGQRLLKLVNTLLDFARLEAGRIQASFEPTDLAALTADLASHFRSAIERAGLTLEVACEPLGEPVYVDRDMIEKIVLNLLSNAFKHTFAGRIAVRLHADAAGRCAVLEVEDTGIGIPAHELGHVFERFHRIRGAASRTHEGTGIGLALVHELVRQHGGDVRVASTVGVGTTMTVRIPLGREHLAPERVHAPAAAASSRALARPFVEEALRWIPAAGEPDADAPPETSSVHGPGRILLADDNADMRAYVARLLRERWEVETVANGADALAAIRGNPPDLVVTDVMMPRVDGFALLRAIREDAATATLPVILLSARAGDEAATQALASGATDYLVKPFSSRELVARVATHLALGRARQVEAAANARLVALFANAPCAVSVVHGPAAVLELANARFAELLGRAGGSSARMTGERLRDWSGTSEIAARLFALVEQVRSSRAPVTVDELWSLAGTNPDRCFLVHCQPIDAGEGAGEVDTVLTVAIDVTEQARLRRDVHDLAERERAARAQAETASRLKDEFLATISHELRTPLQSMLGWAGLLQNGSRLTPERLAKGLAVIERNARAQAQIVDDILDVSRIITGRDRLNVERFALVPVLEAAVDTVRAAAEAKGIHLEVAIDPAVTSIQADPDRLQQIVWNLLANAVKFTPSDGRVSIRVDRAGDELWIVVSDTGKGIPRAFLPHVFERFRQADGSSTRVQSGLGLGLAIVRHLVELHGGRVSVASEGEGFGATFTVELPVRPSLRTDDDTREVHAPPASGPAPRKLDGRRILVVDDEADARELLTVVLAEAGAEPLAVGSAAEVMTALPRFAPDLLVADIGMPDEDGYSLIRRIRALPSEDPHAHVPALALTAYARVEDRRQALAAGFQDHVPKPVDPRVLLDSIARALEGADAATSSSRPR